MLFIIVGTITNDVCYGESIVKKLNSAVMVRASCDSPLSNNPAMW